MASSAQLRQKIADTVGKRSKVDQDISKAESTKAKKEAEAADKSARAAKATQPSTARMYANQAESARKAALTEGNKIAALAKKRADLSKDEAKHNKDLADAVKKEDDTTRRAEAKQRRDREQDDRRRETARRAEERKRQQEALRAQRQYRDDQNSTLTLIGDTEHRLAQQIAALRPPVQEKLRILYGTATPEGDLRVAQEIRRVQNAVQSALHRDLVDIRYAPDITADDLLNQLTTFQPHVIHFSGHANANVLVFDDGTIEGGQGRTVPIDLFIRTVTAPDRKPALVVLNACESAANLETLLAGVPLAIGMSASVGDADAITFATRFYRAVADGQSVEAALALARVDMEMNGLPDHDLPTLVTAPGVDPAQVRLVLPADDDE